MERSIVVVPTYQEKENIVTLVDTVMSLPQPFDLLVVDDNSPDGTAELVKELQQQYNAAGVARLHLLQRCKKLGLGTAYMDGFGYALANGYDYILEMDADFSHNPQDLARLQAACKEGRDMAIGSRYISGVNVVNWSIQRVLLSYFASVYVRAITRMPIHDATAGFVCYRRHALEAILQRSIKLVGYGFQIEMKFWVWKMGFSIQEVPIIFTERTRGSSKLSTGIFKEAFFGVIALAFRGLFAPTKRKEEVVAYTKESSG